MGNIILKIPRRKNRVKIIRSDELIENELSKYIAKDTAIDVEEEILEEPILQEDLATEQQATKTYFSERFAFNETAVPLEISLKHIPLNMLHKDVVKVQLQNAYDKGFNDGQEVTAAAYENDIKKLKDVVLGFELLAIELRKAFSTEIEFLEKCLIPATIMISESIINNEISESSVVFINQLKKAIKEMDEEEIIKILINPADVDTLERTKGSLLSNKSKADKIEISADSSIEKGSCIIMTDAGIIDAKIKTQLEKIRQTMIETIEITSIEDYLENERK